MVIMKFFAIIVIASFAVKAIREYSNDERNQGYAIVQVIHCVDHAEAVRL